VLVAEIKLYWTPWNVVLYLANGPGWAELDQARAFGDEAQHGTE
jgi:hypothetical protein